MARNMLPYCFHSALQATYGEGSKSERPSKNAITNGVCTQFPIDMNTLHLQLAFLHYEPQ